MSHPPHVMSDHILLASAVHGGLATEALLPLLNWRHVQFTGACLRWRADGEGAAPAAAVLGILAGRQQRRTAPSMPRRPCPTPGRGRAFLRVYCTVAGALAALVSAECYFTGGHRAGGAAAVVAGVLHPNAALVQ